MVQGMTEAEAKRQQQRRAWDAEHLRSIGTKLTPLELARLDAYCFWIRTTRYSLLRALVLEELAAYERENRVTLDAPRAATERRPQSATRLHGVSRDLKKRRRAARSSSRMPASVSLGMDAAACGLQNQAPFRLWKTL